MYPKLYNYFNELQAVLDNIISDTAVIKRVVNGEFTFSFEAFESELKSEYFNTDNKIVVVDQTFDIRYVEQSHSTDIKYSIQCEHVNYRMQDGDNNIYVSYGFSGTPTEILENILAGTEFSVGTVEYYNSMVLVSDGKITKKALIYQLANLLGGEVEYTDNGFTINILNSIGNDNGFQVRFGKNLRGIRKIIDSRGGLKTSYSVDIVELKNSNEYIEQQLQGLETIGVGDTIRIIDDVIGLDVQNRILSIEYNPIFAINTNLEIANTIELITDKITQLENGSNEGSLHQGVVYNGIRISPEEGFVAERSDGRARVSMNAIEGITIELDVGDDEGLQPVFYVGPDGHIKAKQIDIDGSGTFEGSVDVTNGDTQVQIARIGSTPFQISHNYVPIFTVDDTGRAVFEGEYNYAWLDEPQSIHQAYIELQNGRIKVADVDDSQALYFSNEGISTTPSGNNATGIIDFRSSAFGNSSDGSVYNGINVRTNGSPVSLQSMLNQVIISPNVRQAVLDGLDLTVFDKFTFGMRKRWGTDVNGNINYSNKVNDGDGLLYWGPRTWNSVTNNWDYRVGLQFSSNDYNKYVKIIDGDGELVNIIAKNVQAVDAIAVTKNESEQITNLTATLADGSVESLPVTWDANGNIASIGSTTITW